MSSSITIVLPNGQHHLLDTKEIIHNIPKDVSPDKYIAEAKNATETNFWDEILLYNEKGRQLVIARFKDFPKEVREVLENGEKVTIDGYPDFDQVHYNDEPDEYDVHSVTVKGENIDDALKQKVIKAFDYKKGNDIDIDEMDGAIGDVKEDCPVDVPGVELLKRDDGTVDIMIHVVKQAKGLVIVGLTEEDPLFQEIQKKFGDKYLSLRPGETGARDYRTKDGDGLLEFIDQRIEEHDNYYQLAAIGQDNTGPTYVVENSSGKLVFSVVKFSGVTEANISGPDASIVQKLFEGSVTKSDFAASTEKVHAHFAKEGKIVLVEDNGFNILVDGSLEFNFRYELKEGPTKIVVSGELPIDQKKVEEIFGKPAHGETYTYTEVQNGGDALRDYLVKEGYVIKPDLSGRSMIILREGEIEITISVARISDYKIKIVGEHSIDPVVVARQFEDKTGDFFNIKKFQEGLGRVGMTKQFHEIQPDYIIASDGDVVPVIHARPTGSRQIIAGFGYSMGFMGMLDLGLKRFSKEEHLNINGKYAPYEQTGSVSFYDPWFFGKRRSLRLSVFGSHWDWNSRFWEVGMDAGVGFPVGGTFSPWMIETGLGFAYNQYMTKKPDDVSDIPVILSPKVTIGYYTEKRKAYVTLSGNMGRVNYPEIRGGFQEKIPVFWEIQLELAAAAGHKFDVGEGVPLRSQYHVFNTPLIYGQGLSDVSSGLSYMCLSAKLSYAYQRYVGAKLGVTFGGVGNTFQDMANIGAGGEIMVPMIGLSLGLGYMYNLFNQTGKFGVILKGGGEID